MKSRHENGLRLRLPATLVPRKTDVRFVNSVSETEQRRDPVERLGRGGVRLTGVGEGGRQIH